LHKDIANIPHPAAPMLDALRRVGAPVQCSTPDWNSRRLEDAINRGSHQSASLYHGFLEQEMVDFAAQGYWVVLPFESVKNFPGLRLAPLGVVPQRGRRPRTIVDYTFWGLNGETIKLATREAMQFGHALERLLYKIHHASEEHGPVYLLKVDLFNGFYRIPVREEDLLKLGVVFPTAEAP
jgi:hypothetical protein